MYCEEVNDRSPLRILERSIHGGLGPGNLGVVMARAGVGKTAFLVQVGLDGAMRERPVLHITLAQGLARVYAWYDALFDDLARVKRLADREIVRARVNEHRVIHALDNETLTRDRLDEVTRLYAESAGFHPAALIIDGFDWERAGPALGSRIDSFKAVAGRLGAELWMSAQTHRDVTEAHPMDVTPPCAVVRAHIDVAVFLEPRGEHVIVRLLKNYDATELPETHLRLAPDTLHLMTDNDTTDDSPLPPSAHTLLSGGTTGAEAAFGAVAERFGVREINYTFAGRCPSRRRGLVELGEAELRRGAVSSRYVQSQLRRTFPQDEAFQKVLHSIWHQVTTAGEVFVIGEIQPDDTVKGGTGWAVELARHFAKPVHVFDQRQEAWLSWDGTAWVGVAPPKIRRARFAGTGTRYLTEAGRKAIAELFEASFGED